MIDRINKLYSSGVSAKEISRELGITSYKTRMALTQLGYEIGIPNEDICLEIIKDYVVEEYRFKEIVKKYKLDSSTIKAIFKKYGVELARRKIKVNDAYFAVIDTEEKAYWLGFLFADGYNDETRNLIELSLKAEDIDHIEKFNQAIDSHYKITQKTVGIYKAARLSIRSAQMSKDLAMLGCVKAKSLILEFPQIRDDLVHHFIRGYFDGDGSITSREKNYYFHIIGTVDFLEMCRLKMGMHYTKLDKKGKSYDLRYGGRKNMEKIYSYLYDDATIFLERKENEFKKCRLNSTLQKN